MRSLTYIIIATFLALLVACGRGERDYSSWEQLPADGWAYTDTVSLLPVDTSLTDNDSIIDGTLHVALRHNNAYPYSNIWLELTYHSDGPWLMRDTINMPLADLYGRWLGSGFGTGYQRDLTVSPRSRIIALKSGTTGINFASVSQIPRIIGQIRCWPPTIYQPKNRCKL